jgi:hypothetical protein
MSSNPNGAKRRSLPKTCSQHKDMICIGTK